MLERGVEVDVVRDLERAARSSRASSGRGTRGPLDALERARGRLLPGGAAAAEQRVQRRLGEDVAEAGRGRPPRPRPARAGPARPEDAEAVTAIPSRSSSSTGSKNEQLPIEWKSEARTSASCAGPRLAAVPAERAPRRARTRRGPRAQRVLLVAEDAAASRLRKPCSPASVGYAWWSPAVALKTSPRSRQPRDEAGELLDARDPLAAAADLRPQPARRDARRAARPRRRPRLRARLDRRRQRSSRPRAASSPARPRRRRAPAPRPAAARRAATPARRAGRAATRARSRARAGPRRAPRRAAGSPAGRVGAWSKSLVSSARRASSGMRPEATLAAGSGPVQWEPANRVRSGRKQR